MPKKLTTEEFIERATIVHNNFYVYNNTIYKGDKIKVTITCPLHGDFNQNPYDHTKGHGCSKCKSEKTKLRVKTSEQFVKEASSKHSGFYTYTNTVYKSSRTKVTITCPIHGNFEQNSTDHLAGRGCQKCGKEKSNKAITTTIDQFIERSVTTHKSKYDYSKVNYVDTKSKVVIICPHHGEFLQTPEHHTKGAGCPKCKNVGFNINDSAVLYYAKIKANNIYKFGVTSKKDPINRFELSDREKVDIIFTKEFTLGLDALYNEQLLLHITRNYKYEGPTVLASGNSELITKDITTTLKEFNWYYTPKNRLQPL